MFAVTIAVTGRGSTHMCDGAVAKASQVAIPRCEQSADTPCPDRDDAIIGPVVLITDRGIEHVSNEDAAAAGILGEDAEHPEAIAVAVCDGVSSSLAAYRASQAASKAGVDAMLAALAASQESCGAMVSGLEAAATAAASAGTSAARHFAAAPSCTYCAAIIVRTEDGSAQITVGNVGDSRAYWLPEPPTPAQQLTVDDSLAQELITAGAAPDSDAVQRGAHTLTRWLGADNDAEPWSESAVQTITATGPGTLLVCSDGLWNYLPDAADIARFCSGTDARAAARNLTEYALAAGGQDNITVAVIPVGR